MILQHELVQNCISYIFKPLFLTKYFQKTLKHFKRLFGLFFTKRQTKQIKNF